MSGLHGGLRDRWRAQVITARNVNDATRVLLVVMADHMTGTGRVSVPRKKLAAEIARSPAQVTARINAAVDARWLDRIETGRPGVTATYQAIFGDPLALKVSSNANNLDSMVRASEPSDEADKGSCVTARSGFARSDPSLSVDMVHASESPVVRPSERSEVVAVDPSTRSDRVDDRSRLSRPTTESAGTSPPHNPAAVEHPEVVIARIIEKRRQGRGAA